MGQFNAFGSIAHISEKCLSKNSEAKFQII